MKTRFAIVAVVMLMALAGIVYYGRTLIDETTREAIEGVADIRQMERQISDIHSSLQRLEQLIYRHTVISYSQSDNIEKQILNQLAHMNGQINDFFASSSGTGDWRETDKNEPDSFSALAVNLKKRFKEVSRYIKYYNMVVADVRLRFPSAQSLNGKLLPLNREFITAVNNALSDMEDYQVSGDSDDFLKLLVELRYTWIQQVSIFRMFVISRSGMFDSPKKAMINTLNDRGIFVDRIRELLEKLIELDKQGRLPFEASIAVSKMARIHEDYEQHVNKIKPGLMSDEWRVDHIFLHEKLQPEFNHLNELTRHINSQIKKHSTEIINQTRSVAGDINAMIWITGGIWVVLLFMGYLAFERLIRRPVLMMADAMNAEASGESFYPIMNIHTREARLLVDAFYNMQKQVHSRQTRLESILGSAAEGIITMDENGNIESFNKAAELLFGYKAEEIVGQSISRLFPVEIQARPDSFVNDLCHGKIRRSESEIETTGMRREGNSFPMSIKISEMNVAGQRLFTALVDDVSERITMISNLRHLAEHDSLTGLANRYFFLHELDRVVHRAARGQHADVALLYIDMDNFKYVNDTMGHMAGDKLLIEVSGMLRKRSRETDLTARIGGDEFAVILYDVEQEDVLMVANSFRKKLQDYHFSYEGKLVDVGCSIGIAMVEKGVGKDELLARADLSCNAAKRAGRNRVHLYSDHDKKNLDSLADDMGWVRRIKNAVRNDKFVFVFQPIMHTATHESNRCEVLLRMVDENGEFIMPSGFIPPAERFSLMPEIDRWVVNHAIEYLGSKESANLHLAINLSAASFDNDDIINFITEKISYTGIDPTRITFEITETIAMADLELTAGFLKKLRMLGCRTALDDFGVGYSSFAYLKDLPVDYVKIDGSFVWDIDTNELNKAIVKSMNDVAQAMGKLTVAEFVETESGMHMLELVGVDYLQGYYIGRPEIPEFERRRLDRFDNSVSLN